MNKDRKEEKEEKIQ